MKGTVLIKKISHKTFTEQHDRLRQVDQSHRAIKQRFYINHFHLSGKVTIKYHFFTAIRDFNQQQLGARALIIAIAYRATSPIILSLCLWMPLCRAWQTQFRISASRQCAT